LQTNISLEAIKKLIFDIYYTSSELALVKK